MIVVKIIKHFPIAFYFHRMKKIFLFSVCLALFIACKPIPKKDIDPEQATFATTYDSQMFFKNVRQIYYNLESQEHTKLDVYRIKGRYESKEKPALNFAIVNNWRYDEAYIIVEPNAFLIKEDSLKVVWKNNKGETGEYLFLKRSNKKEHFKFATEIYQSINAKHKLSLNIAGKDYTLFKDSEEKNDFQTILKDYYRLVTLL